MRTTKCGACNGDSRYSDCSVCSDVMGVETNGPAAIAMLLEDVLSRTNMDKATRRDLEQARQLAMSTVEYIKRLHNVDQIIWSNVAGK